MSTPARAPRDLSARVRAATDFASNLVVAAGAGTGKTTLLVERLLSAIGSGRVTLPAIAAITFTEKAAGELRHRLAEGLRELRALAEDGTGRDRRTAAARAFHWLVSDQRADAASIATRAIVAESHLERATVTTIHSLCSEILRAYPLESGLPPAFTVDRGLAGRRLAAEEWILFLAEELGPSGRRSELWERVLPKLGLSQLAEIARVLASGSISDSALQSRHAPFDLRAAIGPVALRLAEGMSEAVAGTPGLTDAPRESLFQAERALRALADEGSAAARVAIESSSRIPGPMPNVRTKNVGAQEAARLIALWDQAAPLLRALAQYDEALEADVFEALLPFARRLRARQSMSGIVDFDGLLVRARDLLRDSPEVRGALKRRYEMLLVDEFQDTDPIQYEIVFFLAERGGNNHPDAYDTHLAPGRLFIVGDAKQSIYRFRGADYAACRRAVRHVLDQGGAEISLTSNFRSTRSVLEPVNGLFREPASPLWSASDFLPPYEPVEAERDGAAADAVEVWSPGVPADALVGVRRQAEAMALAAEVSSFAGPAKAWRYDDVLVLFRGFSNLSPYLRAFREAGIPFVVSGGRTFFTRTEIIQAMAVLRAVADPDDPVAELAYRRSPAGGVPDTDLAAGASAPALLAADTRLTALRAAAGLLPVDAAVRHVLEASGLIALSGLSFEAAQRVANLEKLALAASELARDGRRTLLETLDALEEGFEAGEEGDSPLADESRDAVRVMTIHKAKGLEAPVVILADTAGGQPNQGPSRFLARMSRLAEGEFVTLRGPGFRNAASIAASLDDTRHDEAEDVRLLYVALTRARDRLIVFAGGHRKSSWGDAVASWSEGVTRRTPCSRGPGSPIEAPASLGAPDALARYASAMERLGAAVALPPFRSPSGLGDRRDATEPVIEGAVDALLARDTGRIVHARLAGLTAREAGAAVDEADEILRTFGASPLAGRLAQLDVLGREIPMLLVKDGTRWRGAIDLLYRDPDGTLVVADFKTDATDSGALERHRGQLSLYVDAVRAAMPTVKVRSELWMLRSGRVLPVE